ncbi:MAG: MBL-fold metallo-hydrolase superfamily [Ktedonobacterales bacterium]|nr:MAG: MBL-fold metallo-hydrolase superfamily [Ktedonobacterales bacterium]
MRQGTDTTPEHPFPEGDAPQRIEPDLWRIPVPLPFALRSANIYLIGGGAENGWTLVDSGFGLPADEAALRAGLTRAGATLDAITTLILTHAHPDHIGLSGTVHAVSGAPVYMLAGEDQIMFRVWSRQEPGTFDTVGAMYTANGLPPDEVARAHSAMDRTRHIVCLPPPAAVRTLDDGAELRLGQHSYRAIWTPGHADYHLCLLRDDGLFLAGDHILPTITPNIGWYPNARPDPLGDYYDALARVRDLPARLVLPGHGRPFTHLATRVDELREHHHERSEQILTLLRAQPEGMNSNSVAAALFGARLHSDDDRRFALVEALAHLEHLRLTGRATREDRDGHIVYHALPTTHT